MNLLYYEKEIKNGVSYHYVNPTINNMLIMNEGLGLYIILIKKKRFLFNYLFKNLEIQRWIP